ncbi:MAG: ABC transporter ATP-binding protein [Rhodospirillales bacterium 69-11]|jgi:NitT/TauT family transport system ATP-binding protein|nr:ABC transporter ATP-binding protein [Rhodospirillales bacterium]OJW25932.1 MAG: ABC transporter ATP-binding protein [Rhodospirillales bacterium 69-11]
MLSIERVGRRFPGGTEALRDVSLNLSSGDFVALLGPSGCGKSTLLRLIAGLDQPDSGRLVWDEGHEPTPGEIGFVFQDATLLPWATAEENVYLPLRLRGVSRAEAAPRLRDALARVGLEQFAKARPRQLSGGMRMRVSIARALVTRPRILLMDEPFAALDEFTRHKLQADLLALWEAIGCTVVFVTHSIYEAAYLARRIVLMTPRPGRIASERVSPLPHGHSRLDPAYATLVAEITAAMEQALGPADEPRGPQDQAGAAGHVRDVRSCGGEGPA